MMMQESTPDEIEMLLAFVRDRDASCPNCGYNVRNLTKPICPECQEDLLLKVGSRVYPIRWLLITVAPGIFTGITSVIVAVLFAIALVNTTNTNVSLGSLKTIPLDAIVLSAFFALSAVTAIVIIIMHKRFIRQPQPRQILWAIWLWMIHLCAFFIFLINVIP